VLWPEPGQVYAGNNSSCVLRVSNQNHSVLLTGDIEWQAEQALSSKSALLKSEVLVAPHHGSRTSSSLAFVRAVQPKQVVISSGFHNRYHFPAKSVLDRYHQAGVQTLSTALRGAVFVSLGIVGGIRDNERLN
ncbi:MAG: hypothetical protein KDH94_01060, partial [Coxiellaceae bacterium]|nr:hypothetical protein [Coxiellaceae bacterium]